MTDAGGLPLSRVVAAADRHDIKLVADTPGALQTGRPGQKNRTLPGQRRRNARAENRPVGPS
ncbi:transposase [Erwinia tracheiphila PSU-1]|nr:transposase [Erwinia tracheiphila PSU-1]